MIYFEIAQGIIDYIEDNLYKEIELDDIAKRVNFSLMQVYRIFNLVTGMTPKEYVRRRRLTKSLFDIKYSQKPIIEIALKSGYSTPESFLRAFREMFGVLPSEYRMSHTGVIPSSKPDIMKEFIHRASHESASEGLGERKEIGVFFMYRPAMKLIGRLNDDKLDPSEFYDLCIKNGIRKSFEKIEDALFYCGACLNKPNPYDMHLFGAAVACDYSRIVPDNLEIFDVPASEYAVFYHNPYSTEEHGSIINSVWKAVGEFDPEKYDYEMNMENGPVIEIDDEIGYFLHLPVRKK